MKRKLWFISCCLALAACGGGNESSGESSNVTPSKLPVTGNVSAEQLDNAKETTRVNGQAVELLTIADGSSLTLDTTSGEAFTIKKSSDTNNAEVTIVKGNLTIK